MSQTLKQVVAIGADHGGFTDKEVIRGWLTEQGHQVIDCGAFEYDPADDYPPIAATVVQELGKQQAAGVSAVGILLCRSSAGMVIAANRFSSIRAVSVLSSEQAAHARAHNDANVIALSGDWMDVPTMQACITTFFETPFSAEERHQRRVEQLSALGT
jgi:ribose 5-phosphate isomerase B